MRLGNSTSASYRAYKSRLRHRHEVDVKRLCYRLDQLVWRAERLRRGCATRLKFESQAEKVREKLRQEDH